MADCVLRDDACGAEYIRNFTQNLKKWHLRCCEWQKLRSKSKEIPYEKLRIAETSQRANGNDSSERRNFKKNQLKPHKEHVKHRISKHTNEIIQNNIIKNAYNMY